MSAGGGGKGSRPGTKASARSKAGATGKAAAKAGATGRAAAKGAAAKRAATKESAGKKAARKGSATKAADKKPKQSKKPARRKQAPVMPSEYNLLLTVTLCLLAIGTVMIFSASSTTQILSDGGLANSVHYLQRTLIFASVGLAIMYVLSRRGLDLLRRFTPVILALTFLALIGVLAVGTAANGSGRWLGSGALQLQPSEFAKLALIFYGCAMLADRPRMTDSIAGMAPYLLVVAAACGLVILQPDLGTIMVTVFAVGATLVAAGAKLRDLATIGTVGGSLALFLAMIEPYRRERIMGFLNPDSDLAGAGFQAMQAKIAMGSGGLTGVGIGDGVQKAFYLPEAHTDMIMAVIGEEVGLLGVVAVVGLFGLFGYAGFRIAQTARDRYGKLLAAGLTSLILVQATVNMFAVMGLAPLTGVTLPFVSYGNNSMIVSLIAVGLLLNISRSSIGRSAANRRDEGGAKLWLVSGGAEETPARGRSKSASGRKRSTEKRQTAAGGRGGGRDSRARGAGAGRGGRASRPRG